MSYSIFDRQRIACDFIKTVLGKEPKMVKLSKEDEYELLEDPRTFVEWQSKPPRVNGIILGLEAPISIIDYDGGSLAF